MARIGLSAKIKYLYNPLPPVTEAEIHKRAGLDVDAADLLPFGRVWSYSHGLDKEIVSLPPGGSFPLRGKEAFEALRDLKQYGIMLVDDPKDVSIKDEIKAVRVARNRYRDNGKTKISALRKLRNLTKEEMEDEYRHDYWPYFFNQAAAEILTDYLKTLTEMRDEETDGTSEENVVATAG